MPTIGYIKHIKPEEDPLYSDNAFRARYRTILEVTQTLDKDGWRKGKCA